MENKSIHVFLKNLADYTDEVLDSFLDRFEGSKMFRSTNSFQVALENNEQLIHTYLTSALSTENLIKGYKIFCYMLDDKVVELKMGDMGENFKEIRVSHNIEKMVLANCFGFATRD